MDWRFNTIWFEQLQQDKIFHKNFEKNIILSENRSFENSEYAIFWHLGKSRNRFDKLPASDKLLYLELHWSYMKDFSGIGKFNKLKRLELYNCQSLEDDKGLSQLSDNLQFLHINHCKEFRFTDELLKINKLRVLHLNGCASINTLDFLGNFPHLIDFRFVDTNILDGNLKPILEHPTLRTVGILHKNHYNLRSAGIQLELDERFQAEYKTIVSKGQYSTCRYDYE